MLAESLLSRRVVLIAAAILLACSGVHAFRSLPRALEPRVEAPYAAIELQLAGASVAELDAVVTPRIEAPLLAEKDVLALRSETRDGAVIFALELPRDEAAREAAFGRIEERLTAVRAELAAEFVGIRGPYLLRPPSRYPEIVVTVEPGGADRSPPVAAARELASRLRARSEVARVDLLGEPLSSIVLTYDDRDLIDTGLSPLALREYLRSQSFTAPGGYLERGGAIAPVETAARLFSVADLEMLPIRDPDDGQVVSLGRILDVAREAVTPAAEEIYVAGRPAIVLAITRRDGADLDGFTASVRETVAASSAEGGARAEVVVAQNEPVARELAGFERELTISFVLLLVLLVASLGFRSGFAVAFVVPLVVAASFSVFLALGLAIDFVLLSSLVLVLGILVDNHIVIAERVHRLRASGLDAQAAIGGALSELAGPLTTATAIIAIGFAPVWLADHVAAAYVKPLFFVVLASLAVSLVFSLFVTPLLLKRRAWSAENAHDSMPGYRRVLLRFARPGPALLLVLGLSLLTYFSIARLLAADQVFFPLSAQGHATIDVEYPPGTAIERTRATVNAIAERTAGGGIGSEGAPIRSSVAFVGRSAPAFQASLGRRIYEPHYGQILIGLADGADLGAIEDAAREAAKALAPEARIRVRPVRLGAELDWPIAVRLRGDETAIQAAAKAVAEKLESLGCKNVGTDRGERIEKWKVEPNREALAKRNLTAADLAASMHTVVHGLPIFEIVDGGERVPVFLRAKRTRQDPIETLNEAYVYPRKGEPLVLYEVATVTKHRDFPARARDRGLPSITVRAEAREAARDLAVEREIAAWLPRLEFEHRGVDAEVDGVFASAESANRALLDRAWWAALAIVLLLLVTSRSLFETALIVATIPLSLVGVGVALDATGEPFSFMVLVGMIALAGLVVNNAIVLVSSLRLARSRHRAEDGELREALAKAASERFRPLVLTTLCAIVSMAVLYALGGAMWRPLAATILAGLSFATLIVVTALPAVYIAFARGAASTARSS